MIDKNIIPTDFLGNPIKIGDKVIFCSRNTERLEVRYIKNIILITKYNKPLIEIEITQNEDLSGSSGKTNKSRIYKI